MTGWKAIPTPELERLSAYLDGELKPSEASRLEARLRQDAALRQALDELRGTVQAVQSLPAAAPPRDFRLTEQMAGRATGGGLAGFSSRLARLQTYPVLQLGAAVAGLAFAILIGFDVLVSSSLAGVSLSRDAEPAAAPFTGQGAAEALESAELGEDQLMATAAQEPQPTPGPEQALGAPPAEELPAADTEAEEQRRAAQATEQVEAAAEQELEPSAVESEADAEADEPDRAEAEAFAEQGPGAEDQLGQEPAAAAPPPSEQQPAAALRAAGRTALTVAEIGLGAATIVLLVFSLRARRRA